MRRVGNLDGVAERAVEEVEANAERNLELVDQDQEEDVDAGVEALAERDRRDRPGPDRDRRPRGEERVGDRHHPADEGKVRNGEDEDAEQRRRKRQIAGQLVVFVSLRPVAEQGGHVGEAEEDRLGGEQVRQHRQERRAGPSRQGGGRSERRRDADDDHHAVFLVDPDREGEGGEDGEAQHAHGGGPEQADGGNARTSRADRAKEGPGGLRGGEKLERSALVLCFASGTNCVRDSSRTELFFTRTR